MNDLGSDVVDLHVNWLEVHRDAKTFVRKLLGVGSWKCIVAVSPGRACPDRDHRPRNRDSVCRYHPHRHL